MPRPVALRVLAYPTILAGAALFVYFLFAPVPATGGVLLAGFLFGVAAVALATVEISLGGKISLSPEISAVLLALLLYGPGAASIAVTMSSVSVCLRRKRTLLRTLFTPAQFIISVGVFTALYSWLYGPDFGARAAARALDGGASVASGSGSPFGRVKRRAANQPNASSISFSPPRRLPSWRTTTASSSPAS